MDSLLTKSQFKIGRHCPKRLYLAVHSPALAEPVAQSNQRHEGTQIGVLARDYYPDGLLIGWGETGDHPQELTRTAIEAGAKCLYEPVFAAQEKGVLVRCDILRRIPGTADSWHLIEVKSGTSLKADYLIDTAFQVDAVRAAGIKIDRVSILYLNNKYVFDGKSLSISKLFIETDVTEQVELAIPPIRIQTSEQQHLLNEPFPPDVETNKHCADPLCEFHSYCHTDQPLQDLIYLPRISAQQVIEYRQAGYRSIDQLPKELINPQWSTIWTVVTEGKPHFGPALKTTLSNLRYPLHFIDFESIAVGIPLFKGTRPYSAVVFQWSNHIIEEPDKSPRHEEYLHRTYSDPRQDFAASLWRSIKDAGTIFVYSGFEATQIKSLARENVKYGAELLATLERRGIDLLKVLRENVYHENFKGSYSIKKVLPTLVPKLSYADLPIHDGGTASLKYLEMLGLRPSEEYPQQIASNLLQYCALDTLAMVEIWKTLVNAVAD